MCAINGFNFKNEALILKMNRVTSHRGPDGTGVFLDENISLGHNRLSIIDLSASAGQPMKSENGRFIIVFNGEIYNFNNLKKELLEFYKFNTNSDTEVILAAYEKWGSDVPKKLDGIFAFAIWDKERKELFLARDHVGVKPLYYYFDGKNFIFSSEIKAILEHDIPRVLNKEALNHYFRMLYVPNPLTMFENIFKFPPGHCGILKENKLEVSCYWNLNARISAADYSELKGLVRKKVIESVGSQLISDRPVGLYLSGGIDSSVILDAMKTFRESVDTFSVGFSLPNPEDERKFNADFQLARQTANYYKTNHHEVLLSPEDVITHLEGTVLHLDEPIANPTAIPMMKLARFTKKSGVDVVLGGDGGDELFGGYERYRLSLFASYYEKFPEIFRKFLNFGNLRKLNTPPGIKRFALFMFQKDEILRNIMSPACFNEKISEKFFENKYFSFSNSKSFEESFMSVDRQSWLVDDSLMKTDKTAMSQGVEARVPLLSKDLVEFASSIPLKYKVNLRNTKIILKESFKGRIPDYLMHEPKRGWFSPAAKWLRDPAVYTLSQMILSPEYFSETKELFNWSEVRKMLVEHNSGKKYNLTTLWALIIFQVWAKIYKIKMK